MVDWEAEEAPTAASFVRFQVGEVDLSEVVRPPGRYELSWIPDAKVEIQVWGRRSSKTTEVLPVVEWELDVPPGTEVGYCVSAKGRRTAMGSVWTTDENVLPYVVTLPRKEHYVSAVLIASAIASAITGVAVFFLARG